MVDFRKKAVPPTPVIINGQAVEIVHSYKYLGVIIDDKLNWKKNSDALYKKAQSRLFYVRKLRSFDVCQQMLFMFNQCCGQCPVLRVCVLGRE